MNCEMCLRLDGCVEAAHDYGQPFNYLQDNSERNCATFDPIPEAFYALPIEERVAVLQTMSDNAVAWGGEPRHVPGIGVDLPLRDGMVPLWVYGEER